MTSRHSFDDLRVITIPSSDTAFRRHVDRLHPGVALRSPEELQERLRRVFPRAVVRQRDISGETAAWYVYRDGSWRPSMIGPWWDEPGLPRVEVSRDGWIEQANATALGILALDPSDIGARHVTDFVVPGGLEDSQALFAIVDEGHPLTATALLRPATGDIVAIDLHARREGNHLLAVFRLSDDIIVEPPAPPQAAAAPLSITSLPASDAAFRGYVDLAMSRMPEPTPDGLAVRLRRLYPHAHVAIEEDGRRWMVYRDAVETEAPAASSAASDPAVGAAGGTAGEPAPTTPAAWWADPRLPRVRYDAQALILEANGEAEALLGRHLVGHHWQEFVTPGSTEQVTAMLAILAEVGHAESRFRMPRADGSLLEFDSYTEVVSEGFTTVMRPRA